MILPATAYDQTGRSARGYTQGRFRGNNMVYGEVEYRFPLSKCGGLLGGVLFANATTANNPFLELDLFGSIKPSAGFGLRVKLDKYSRTNLAIDLAFGQAIQWILSGCFGNFLIYTPGIAQNYITSFSLMFRNRMLWFKILIANY